MHPNQVVFVRRCLLVAWVGAVTATATDTLTSAFGQTPAAGAPAAAAAKTPQKKIKLELRDRQWKSVIETIAEQAGLPLSAKSFPTGTFNLITPKTGSNEYTLPDLIDIINEALTTEKNAQYLLIRRSASLILVPADEEIDPAILPRLTVNELDDRGSTELVNVVLQLNALVAEDVAAAVRKIMGPFGKVVDFPQANQLVLTDTVGNLRRIVKTLEDMEKNDGKGDYLQHRCIYVKARDAEKLLQGVLGDPRDALRALQQQQDRSSDRFRGGPPDFGGGFDRGPGGSRFSQQQTVQIPKFRMHYIAVDDRSNSVIVRGPANIVATARATLKTIDVPQFDGQKPVLVGDAILKVHNVPAGNAETVVKLLKDRYKDVPTVRIEAAGNSQILVWAMPEEQFEIAKHIIGGADAKTELILLNSLDANKTAETLLKMFGEIKSGAPYIESAPEKNAIIVKGTGDQVREVQDVLKALGEGAATPVGNMRVITLDKGGAAALAEELQRLMSQMRKNPVKVITPGSGNTEPEPKDIKPQQAPPRPAPGQKQTYNSNDPRSAPIHLVGGQGGQLVDPQAQKKKDERPGREDAPVNIMAVGNRLIISSDDPAAMQMINELVRLLTATQAGEGDFEIIRLKYANATEAASILDQAFNGTRDEQRAMRGGPGFGGFGGSRGGFSPFFSQFAAPGASTPATPTANRIRVVADTGTNSLLVKASPLDMLQIRRLLDKAIDTDENDSAAIVKTWLIPVKNGSAMEIANVIRDVYRDHMNATTSNTIVGGFSGFSVSGFGGHSSRGSGGSSRGSAASSMPLSIGVDDRSNQIVAACSERMYEELKKLIEDLDTAAESSTKTVKVMSIKGIDPVLVQQAIEAVQGRPVNRAGMSSSPWGGTSGFSPSGRSSFGGGSSSSGFSPSGRSSFGGGFGSPSGGFSPFSGGGFRGGSDGGFRGPGGGSSRGGGPGGGSSQGGGGRTSSLDPGGAGGPDFFEQRVMDDPQPSFLFDPQLVSSAEESQTPDTQADSHLAAQQPGTQANPQQKPASPAQPPAGPPAPPTSGEVTGPRSNVTAEPLSELGLIVITGNNPQDVETVVKIIEYLQKLGAGAEVDIQLVPLKWADATSTAATLNQLFSRVNVGPGGLLPTAVPRTTQATTPFGALSSTSAQAASIVLLPLARFNAILVGAPKGRMETVLAEIRKLDVPIPAVGGAVPIPLKKAAAFRVATLLNTFYAQRYAEGTANQIRITYEDLTNTIFVQAAPNDLAEIRRLIEHLDSTVSSAVNDLRIFRLRYAVADDMANVLLQAITAGATPLGSPAGTVTTGVGTGATGAIPGLTGGGFGGIPGGGLTGGGGLGATGGGFGGLQGGGLTGAGRTGLGGAGIGAAGGVGAAGTTFSTQSAVPTKVVSLRFISDTMGPVESGLLQDVHISTDPRVNAVIVSAPAKTIELVKALIDALDVLPTVKAEVNVFTLKKADATLMSQLLQQLFYGAATTTGAVSTQPVSPTGAGGGFGAAGAATALGAAAAAGGVKPIITFPGVDPAPGTSLVDLRISVDQRTNSIIVAGSPNDLAIAHALITKLDDTPLQQRQQEVYRLRYLAATDAATTLGTFIQRYLQVYATSNQLYYYQEMQRDIIIIPEPINNALLISATPQHMADVLRLISQIDMPQPQVAIQVLIAEVDLTNNEEFGVEIGLQSPVFFQRSILPLVNAFGANGSVTYAGNPPASTNTPLGLPLVNNGVTVNNSMNPTAFPGYNFNNVTFPLGNNPLANPGIVGFQGLGNFGVGRASPTQNVGGFVFSAGSDAFNLLIRALKVQSRIDILNRPQITVLNNQTAFLNIGREIPIVTTAVATLGVVTQNIDRRQIGVLMQVTPQISPDGSVLLRVVPEVSSQDPNPVPIGNGITSIALNIQHLETTVLAKDGETIAIGGLISKSDSKVENKIPWLGDLPVLGALFRYRTQFRTKKELLIIMTPHIVRSPADAARILAEESKRIDWVLRDIVNTHGTSGLEPIFPPPPTGLKRGPGSECPPGTRPPGSPPVPPRPPIPPGGTPADQVPIPGMAPADQLQMPRPVPPEVVPAPSGLVPPANGPAVPMSGPVRGPAAQPPANVVIPAAQYASPQSGLPAANAATPLAPASRPGMPQVSPATITVTMPQPVTPPTNPAMPAAPMPQPVMPPANPAMPMAPAPLPAAPTLTPAGFKDTEPSQPSTDKEKGRWRFFRKMQNAPSREG